MINRLFFSLLLLACTIALTASADAQITVSSHTSIITSNSQERIVTTCQTLMQDPQGPANYPGGVAAQCTLNQNGALQTLPQCIHQTSAICPTTLGVVSTGTLYQTTAKHGLFMQVLTKGCTQNGAQVDCLFDPLSYGINSIPTLPPSRQFADQGVIFPPFPPVGPSFWIPLIPGNNDGLIASSAETPFESAQVDPFIAHVKAKDVLTLSLNGRQNANWTFIGSSGFTNPGTPSQGFTIDFHAPDSVPIQMLDTLQGCKVDISHGMDCSSSQIIVEVVNVSIPAGNPNDIPRPDNSTELLGGDRVQYKATVTQGGRTVTLPVKWSMVDNSGLHLINFDPEDPSGLTGFFTVQPQTVFQKNVFFVSITATVVDQQGNPLDPAVAVSAPFDIRITPATVTMTTVPSPGLNDKTNPDVYQAIPGRSFHFEANVVDPQNPNNRVITTWDENFIPGSFDFAPPGQRRIDPNNPNAMDYVINSPAPKSNIISTTIKACVGGHVDTSILGSVGLVGATCAFFPMVFQPRRSRRPPRRRSTPAKALWSRLQARDSEPHLFSVLAIPL